MKTLLVYPKYPDTYWSFTYALKFISKKAAVPPLGLITVSAMLPDSWEKRLVDMNVTTLQTSDILWADYVFISAMYVQKESVDKVIQKCLDNNVKMVAGGPLFTQEFQNYPQIDHFVLNEAEITLPPFLEDLKYGRMPQKIYNTETFAEMSQSPVPDFHLLEMDQYASMNIQVTRGCPYACDFCEITSLLGHKVRMKETAQVIRELDALHQLNWRGAVSVVDDNFIGNRNKVKKYLLPAMGQWMKDHDCPFSFSAQTSINLADDKEMMNLMTVAGFRSTFIGIETPDEMSLADCHKSQNRNRNLIDSVKDIQKAGIQVSGGFIVGFDSDSPTIFQRQVDFIQQSGIVSAMVGLLNAPKNTKLYHKLEKEKRLTTEATGSNTDFTMNFIPKMDYQELLNGYKDILQKIYSSRPYYKRIRRFMLNYKRQYVRKQKIQPIYLIAFLKSLFIIGMLKRGRSEFWKFLFWTLFKKPQFFMDAIVLSVYGYHFRTIYGISK